MKHFLQQNINIEWFCPLRRRWRITRAKLLWYPAVHQQRHGTLTQRYVCHRSITTGQAPSQGGSLGYWTDMLIAGEVRPAASCRFLLLTASCSEQHSRLTAAIAAFDISKVCGLHSMIQQPSADI